MSMYSTTFSKIEIFALKGFLYVTMLQVQVHHAPSQVKDEECNFLTRCESECGGGEVDFGGASFRQPPSSYLTLAAS